MRTVLEIGKLAVLATCVGLACSSVSVVAASRHELDRTIQAAVKAPREGATEVTCACSSTAELDAIRSCICYIRNILGDTANDTVVPCMTTLAEINEADLTIISWLKTLYAADLGYAAVPCEGDDQG